MDNNIERFAKIALIIGIVGTCALIGGASAASFAVSKATGSAIGAWIGGGLVAHDLEEAKSDDSE